MSLLCNIILVYWEKLKRMNNPVRLIHGVYSVVVDFDDVNL